MLSRHSIAILTLSHIWSRGIAREHRKRIRECSSFADVYLLYHLHQQPAPACENMMILDNDWLERKANPRPRLPQSAGGHLPFLLFEFVNRHPEYQTYWVLEYDMRFTGSWADFFERMAEVPADYYTTHIYRHEQQPDWNWWSSLSHPVKRIAQQDLLRSLNTIYGLSNRAVDCLKAFYADGWSGHYEVLFSSMLSRAGLSVVDIGGKGAFTPAIWRGKHYTAAPPRRKGIHRNTTLRVLPARLFLGLKKNHLYHPIKPFPLFWRSWRNHLSACLQTAFRKWSHHESKH
jgi:hypothetical protein